MDDRPPKLPFAATRAVKASRVLGAGQKLVWLEDWALDGPEGAWIASAHLAARLGMSKQNVDQHRQHLRALGLHVVIPRPGARTQGWRATLPPACVPPLRPTVEQVMTYAAQLDAYLKTVANGKPACPDGQAQLFTETSPLVPAPPEARREGGRGEGSILSSGGRETTLQPPEDGEVARATEGRRTAEDGDARARGPRGVLPQAPGRRSREESPRSSPEELDHVTRELQAKWLAKRGERPA